MLILVGCVAPTTVPSPPTPSTTAEESTTTETPAEIPTGKVEPQSSQQETIGLPEIIQEAPQSNELILRNYVWEFGGEWSWELTIPKSLYEYYKGIPRPPTVDYSVYVTHPVDDIYIDRLAGNIRDAALQEGYDDYQTVELAIAFVQNLPYTFDSVTSPYDEYPRYPIETLVDNGGDCEDTSILLASLLSSMGYGIVLIQLPDHCAVGLKGGENIYGTYWEYEGAKYYYLETTNTGWGIGELPEEYENTSAHIYPMVPTPIITHEWIMEGKGNYAELKVKVSNQGSATASNVYVFAGFDAGGDKVWSPEQSESFQLGAGQQVTVTMFLSAPPPNIHTRVVVQIAIDDYSVSESYSEWFDT